MIMTIIVISGISAVINRPCITPMVLSWATALMKIGAEPN